MGLSLNQLSASNEQIKTLVTKKESGTLSESEKLTLETLEKNLSTIEAKINDQLTIIDQLAILKVKVDTKIATQEEITKYQQLENQLRELISETKSVGISADVYVTAQDIVRKEKLKALELSAKPGLQVATPKDLIDYIQQTIPLNPYSRFRACDKEMIDLMLSVSKDLNAEIKNVEELKKLITL